MATSKDSEVFCLTSYKMWLALLAVMVVVLIIWVAVGFDEDRAKTNLNRVVLDNNFGVEDGHFKGHLQMSKLQESYSDIATKVRSVTVNITASRSTTGRLGNNNGLNFADPFRVPPRQQAFGGGQNIQNPPSVTGVKGFAPPISSEARMPHEYRGVCSKCHTIKKQAATRNMVAQVPTSTSVGSGIIVDPAGYILTNYHIIINANNIIVTTPNGNKYRADVKYSDAAGDLAILKINSTTRLPAAKLGDSDMIQEGDIVLAVGNPFGLNQTVTAGIISDSNRTVFIGSQKFTGLIQTDAAINRGSSGGPLVNIRGEVIGINTAIYSITGDFTGIGFSIPINRAKETFTSVPSFAMAANIIDLNVGEVITIAIQPNVPDAWFGAEVSPIDAIMAEQFGLHSTGVLVNQVFAGSPAENSGLLRGDAILKINGRKIANMNKFQKITSSLKPLDTMNLTVKRGNKQILITAKLESRQNKKIIRNRIKKAAAGPPEMEWAGMEVVPVTPELARRYGIRKGEPGVVVLEAEGMAAAAGVMNGDLIKSINRKKINNMSDFVSAISNVNIAEGVLFDVSRQGDPLFLTM